MTICLWRVSLHSNFEQIIKAPHYALLSYVEFGLNLYGRIHFSLTL